MPDRFINRRELICPVKKGIKIFNTDSSFHSYYQLDKALAVFDKREFYSLFIKKDMKKGSREKEANPSVRPGLFYSFMCFCKTHKGYH